jgi:hypothetical protein
LVFEQQVLRAFGELSIIQEKTNKSVRLVCLQTLKYLKANCRNIVDFGRVDFFIFRKHTKFIHHLNNRPAYDFTKFFSEITGSCIIGIADKRYGPIGVQ